MPVNFLARRPIVTSNMGHFSVITGEHKAVLLLVAQPHAFYLWAYDPISDATAIDPGRRWETIMNSLCNCFSLRQANRRVTQLYDQAFAPVGLKATQYSLLNQVATLGPIALNPLAETMVMDRATLGHNVRPLAARGLVRLAVGKDRRSREVSITTAGRDLLASARALWHRAQQSFESEMGKDTSAALRGLLHRVAATEFIRPAGDARPARGRTVS